MARDTLLGFPAHTLPYRRGKFITLSTVSFSKFHFLLKKFANHCPAKLSSSVYFFQENSAYEQKQNEKLKCMVKLQKCDLTMLFSCILQDFRQISAQFSLNHCKPVKYLWLTVKKFSGRL